MRRFASAILVCVAVSACAGGPYSGGVYRDYRDNSPITVGPSGEPPASALARSVTYTFEDSTTITLTEGQRSAQVTLNSGAVLSLARQPDLLGFRYGAPPYEFRGRGAEATFFANNRALRCRAK